MRGILSILASSPPDIPRLKTGLLMLTCSEGLEEKVVQKVVDWMPHVRWEMVKRFEPGIPGFAGETLFSSEVVSIGQQWRFFRSLRKKRFDVLVMVWNGEKSFNMLRGMAYFIGFRYLLVYNENLGGFFAVRKNRGFVVRHVRWRLKQRRLFGSGNPVVGVLSWVFLFPPAFLYITLRVFFLSIRKQLRRS